MNQVRIACGRTTTDEIRYLTRLWPQSVYRINSNGIYQSLLFTNRCTIELL